MARETVTRSSRFYCVSLMPDICKTPIGPATPPIPYSVMGEFSEAIDVSPNVKSISAPVILHQRSTIPTVKGDEPGTAGGIKSGTYGKCVETKTASATLHANGSATVQEGCEVWMNKRNTVGKIYERGGAPPRTRLQQIDAWISEQAAAATATTREKLRSGAQHYKDNVSAPLHQFGQDAMNVGGKIGTASGGVALAGAGVAATGVGAPVAVAMEAGATAGGVVAAGVTGVGGAADTAATVGDMAADFILTGKTPEMMQAALGMATRLLENAVLSRIPFSLGGLLKKFPALQKLIKRLETPGKKSAKPPSRPPDKPPGGKSKKKEKDAKSDKPSSCCPRDSAPGGKPVSGRKPVHFGTGEEVLYQTDFMIDGPRPIAWTRCYRSGSEHEDWGLLGARWSLPFTASLLLAGDGMVYVDDSGRAVCLPLLAPGGTLDNRKEGFTLNRPDDSTFVLTWRDGSNDTFRQHAGEPPSWLPHGYRGINAMRAPAGAEHATRFNLCRSEGRDGRGFSIERHPDATPGPVLLRLRSDDGHIVEAMRADSETCGEEHPRIGCVEEIRQDGTRIRHVVYHYAIEADASNDDGATGLFPRRFNLVTQTNIAGDSRRYTYRDHLLLSCSNYGGFISTLRWISLAALRARWSGSPQDDDALRVLFPVTTDNSYQARATGSAGADGSDALHIAYLDHDTSRVTDAAGGVLDYTFDTNWLAVEVRRVQADGRAISLGRRLWDRDGMLLADIDAAGHATSHSYDEVGNIIATTDALGHTSAIAYDEHNQPITLTDALGNTTRLGRDTEGRIATYTDALGHASAYRYDAAGRLIEIQDARGGIKRLEYDGMGRLRAYTDCSGSRSTYDYDADGRVCTAVDALGNATRYDYDLLGRPLSVVRPDGARDRYAFDADGNLLSHTDARGCVTAYEYDGRGLPVKRIDALGRTLRYRHDAALRLVELVNGNGDSYRLAYDADGALVAETGFDGKVTRYRYDRAGQLTGSECRGVRVDLMRDRLGQLIARQSADGVTRYAYDPVGRLSAVTAPHAEQRYAYDAMGRLLEERGAYYLTSIEEPPDRTRRSDATFILSHAYDELGNRTRTVLPNGRRIDIERYGAGHWHGTLWQGEQIVAIERDALHRETQRRIGAARQPVLADRSYDPQSRLAALTLRRDERTRALSARRFHYDPAGNLLAVEQDGSANVEGVFSYAYDPVGQLLSAAQPGLTETFAFDPAGNLLETASPPEARRSKGEDAGLAAVTHNLLRSYHGRHYRYDAKGNVVSKRVAPGHASANGTEYELELEYDADNRLTHAIKTTSTHRITARYFYDAFSRRIAKRVVKAELARRDSPSPSDVTSLFVWDGDLMVQELCGDKTVTYLYEPESFVPLARIASVRGSDGDGIDLPPVQEWRSPGSREKEPADSWIVEHGKDARPLADADTASGDDRIEYFHCDHLGTPQELFDSAGNVVWSGRFRAWGGSFNEERTEPSARINEQSLRFQGQYRDQETGLHYNRYRYYDADVGRFVSEDPVGLLGGANAYAYAQNPIVWMDPLGLTKCQSNSSCNPCLGRNVSAEAMATQGVAQDANNPYSGVDSYQDMVLKKGTILYSLHPGGTPGFAVTNHTLIKSSGDVDKYHDLTQVTPGVDKMGNPRKPRTSLRVYRLKQDTCVAKGVASANSQFGKGGATQYYISPSDSGNLTSGKIRPI